MFLLVSLFLKKTIKPPRPLEIVDSRMISRSSGDASTPLLHAHLRFDESGRRLKRPQSEARWLELCSLFDAISQCASRREALRAEAMLSHAFCQRGVSFPSVAPLLCGQDNLTLNEQLLSNGYLLCQRKSGARQGSRRGSMRKLCVRDENVTPPDVHVQPTNEAKSSYPGNSM